MNLDDFSASFPITIELPVQWGEMDALGHVNNAVYFRYFESVRIAYLQQILYPRLPDQQRVLPVLADTACRYKKPLRYPDTITVGCTVTEVQGYGFSQEYEIYSHQQQAVTTTGVARIVLLEKQTQQKYLIKPELFDELHNHRNE